MKHLFGDMHKLSKAKILLIKKGDHSAFREFYDIYSPLIYNLSFRLLKDHGQAEEIVQESFLNIWLNRSAIDEHKDLWALLYVSSKRLCLNQLRKTKSVNKYLDQLTLQDVNDIEQKINYTDLENFLNQRIAELSPQQRKAFELSRIDGYTHQEIADEMRISTNTVKNHITKALKQLRTYLYSSKYMIRIISFFLFFL